MAKKSPEPQSADLGFAHVDLHRVKRVGFPEVIFGEGKSKEQIAAIAERIILAKQPLLITRVEPEVYAYLRSRIEGLQHNEKARCIYLEKTEKHSSKQGNKKSSSSKTKKQGLVLVLTGGTTDIPVAEEAALTARMMGCQVKTLYDVGVAGLHRLISHSEELRKAAVIIVVAGMEGALPSVVGGLVACPIIAVPTSVGYGSAFGGLAPLLAMLNSCAPGVTVVNINNGFGAGYAAGRIM